VIERADVLEELPHLRLNREVNDVTFRPAFQRCQGMVDPLLAA
jgi:hypothetical protein